MRTDLVEDALRMAIILRGERPATVVCHADRGTQGASDQITRFAAQNGITRSMGRTGVCWDNAMAESFFATLKTEFHYRRVWPTKAGAARAVGAWIEDRYNRRRRHSALGQISPVSFELQSARGSTSSRISRCVHETGSRPVPGPLPCPPPFPARPEQAAPNQPGDAP